MAPTANFPLSARPRRPVICLAAIAIAMLSAGGCGRKSGLERASVGGEVTLDGQPVQQGSIRFVCLTGGPTAGGQIEDGSYHIPRDKGPPLGRHRVEVSAPQKTGRQIPSPFALAQRKPSSAAKDAPTTEGGNETGDEPNENPMQSAGSTVDEWVDMAPPEYGAKSTLEVEISAGKNSYDIHMKRSSKRP